MNYNIAKLQQRWKVRVLGWRPASCSLSVDGQIAGPPAPSTPEAGAERREPF